MDRQMQIHEIIGKTITNFYSLLKWNVDGVDIFECFIELDNSYFIGIPYPLIDEVEQKELNPDAQNLFADFSDIRIPHFRIKHRPKKSNIFHRLRNILLGHGTAVENNVTCTEEVEYVENKMKYIKDRQIVDVIWYANDCDYEVGYILLDNGYLITAVTVAPYGTGTAHLYVYESINDLTKIRGSDYFKLTSKNGCH